MIGGLEATSTDLFKGDDPDGEAGLLKPAKDKLTID